MSSKEAKKISSDLRKAKIKRSDIKSTERQVSGSSRVFTVGGASTQLREIYRSLTSIGIIQLFTFQQKPIFTRNVIL